ncbi:SIR2 family protein [Sporosarcina sp. ZBG7A]|uniref:SIR2 family protein n=1 Tax=Sporosarcina sp. ZBG7A TaxID=1582223 RepID=UPI00057A869E|nr:SIR2 family protein [Sporosarcina sp. ZBG7A]
MNIRDFITGFKNHPVLFVGTGMSLRYLKNSYTWDALLKYISLELTGANEYYYDIKSKYEDEKGFDYPKIATDLETGFNEIIKNDRHGKFKQINDVFYEKMDRGINVSRFKLYIASLLMRYELKEEKQEEIAELKKIRKNIGSVITTNYDTFIEDIFDFKTLIGNEILLSNPYGSIYKIHGSLEEPNKIIITSEDYQEFNERYELIRAQLLSLFIHHPIIFLGYNIGDENIKDILKTIFTYVNPNTTEAEEIRKNFLLVEYEEGFDNLEITQHDIDMKGFSTIRINKIKTDNFIEIYKSLSDLVLPVSAMDIRKVQSIVKEIYAGGDIKVSITEDIDSLSNGQKVLAIGSLKTIKYEFHTISEMMENYFDIIEEANHQLLKLIDKLTVQNSQYFPIFGFKSIQENIESFDKIKQIQLNKIENLLKKTLEIDEYYTSIQSIDENDGIAQYRKENLILHGVLNGNFTLEETEDYLKKFGDKKTTEYRRLLCVYDYKKYSNEESLLLEKASI